MTTERIDEKAVRAAAMAKTLAELFTPEERRQIVEAVLKPMLEDQPGPYGGKNPSVLNRAAEQALINWVEKEVGAILTQETFKKPLLEGIEKRVREYTPHILTQFVERYLQRLFRT